MTVNFNIVNIPVQDFVDEFMRRDDLGPVPEVDFTGVPYDSIERDMYVPFVCPDNFFCQADSDTNAKLVICSAML